MCFFAISVSSVKREHEYDLAFLMCVIEKAVYTIDKIAVIHVNSEYVRRGEIDTLQIADETDITNAVRSLNIDVAKIRQFPHRLIDWVQDLKTPFLCEWCIDKDFFRNASIKAVLPVLVPELSYDELAISNGTIAQQIWMQLVQQGLRQDRREEILNDLHKYYHLDTHAMVKIWEHITAVASSPKT